MLDKYEEFAERLKNYTDKELTDLLLMMNNKICYTLEFQNKKNMIINELKARNI